ncbi:MAG: flagellar basal body L-ring protein FlgH [Maricaulaceae bacterium]
MTRSQLFRFLLLGATALSVTACAVGERLSYIGQAPPLEPIEDPGVEIAPRVVQIPVSPPPAEHYTANSLWRTGAREFFEDQRAKRTGDILTVQIDIQDEAQLQNTTIRNRITNEDSALEDVLGLAAQLTGPVGQALTAGGATTFNSTSQLNGIGNVDRSEDIALTVAAIVTQILPNGNLVIGGRQQLRVNHELRDLTFSGIVRPEDITAANTIDFTQVAEARLSYGGRGILSDTQRPRYGQELFDVLFPF